MSRRAQRWGVRTRLTALIAALVVGVGLAMLATMYWLQVASPPPVSVVASAGNVDVAVGDTGVTVFGTTIADPTGGEPVPVPAVPGTDTVPPTPSGEVVQGEFATVGQVPAEVMAAVRATSEGYQTELARRFVLQSLLLLVVLTAAAVAIGWYASRRALRPVHAITDTARRLGAQSLSERIEVGGPRDELRELGETFNSMLDRLQSAFDRERRLMANVSHELRTPLANQRIALEVGLEDHATSTREDLVAVAETALQQNERAQSIVDQVLLLARLEQNGTGSEPPRQDELVDLDAVVQRLAAEPALRRLAAADVSWELGSPADAALVRSDPVLVERLLGNLLENAARHNVEGGYVRITFPADIDTVDVLVENSGPHLDKDAVPALFEPFRRASGTEARDRLRSQDGVGLGLSVVAAAARHLDVTVTATARDAGGMTVRVRWPRPIPRTAPP